MAFSLKMVVFWLRLTTFVTEALVGRFKSRRFDDVCNVCRPPVARLGPAGEVARWFETGVAFARAGRASDETAIAFAGEKWAFLVQFSGAEVSSVSTLTVQGRAVVMVVSRWSASAVAVVLLVSTSRCCCVMRAIFVALLGLEWGASAKIFALRAQNTPKSAFFRLLGELFRGRATGGAVLGEFFRANRP